MILFLAGAWLGGAAATLLIWPTRVCRPRGGLDAAATLILAMAWPVTLPLAATHGREGGVP